MFHDYHLLSVSESVAEAIKKDLYNH